MAKFLDYNGLSRFKDKLDDKFKGMESITYSALKTKRDNEKLVPGKYYRITDYVTTTTYTESRALAHKFDVIVLALNNGTLSEEAYAIHNASESYFDNSDLAAWKLCYCLDNDTTRFEWADTTNGKGVIYRMIDEFGNDVPYDFKNIQFKRYKVTPKTDYTDMLASLSGLYIGTPTNYSGKAMMGLDYNSSDYKWYYTFNSLTSDLITPADLSMAQGACANNTYEPTAQEIARKLNNNVVCCGTAVVSYLREHGGFYSSVTTSSWVNNHFGENSNFVTVFGGGSNNYIESQFRGNIIVGMFRHNTIGSDVQDNLFFTHNDFSFNRFQHYLEKNIIKTTDFSHNEIESVFHDNIITATSFNNNSIRCQVYNNVINVSKFFFNVIGPLFYNNSITVGYEFSANLINGSVHDNTITITGSSGSFRFNTISGWFHDNTINPSADNASSTNNIWNGNIYSNTLYQCVNCEFVGQFSVCTASCALYGCRFSIVNVRLTIPASSSYFCGIDLKGVMGARSSTFALDYSGFFALPNAFTPKTIECSPSDSSIIATWKDGITIKGVKKTLNGDTWTEITA